jgi:RNA polymerase sigma-70 factor, ECF subfamily
MNTEAAAASKLVHEAAADQPSDQEVVRQCQDGDLAAYAVLVERYRHKVYGLAFSMLRNEHDATDIAQEAFVRAWQGLPRFRSNASFYTWIYRIATNLCIDFVRRRDRQPTAPLNEAIEPDLDADAAEPPSSHPTPVVELERKELGARIQAALAELSPEHRAVVQLREFDGLDYAEIAAAVGCSLGTVMSRLHYARKHLQKLLDPARAGLRDKP